MNQQEILDELFNPENLRVKPDPPPRRPARPIPVRLFAEDLAQAEQWEREILAELAKHPRPNYLGTSYNEHRYRDGYWGELALARWFKSCRVAAIHNLKTNGRSNGPDFTVGFGGTFTPLEVKFTGAAYDGGPPPHEFRTPKKDPNKPGAIDPKALYIGTRFLRPAPDAWVELCGWDHGATVLALPTRPTYDGTLLHTKGHEDMGDLIDLVVLLAKEQ